MWTILAFISALCLGFYDISKKIALRENRVVDVLTISVCISALLLSVPLWLSRLCPEVMTGTPFYVPQLDGEAHLYTILKSVIVLSSWIFAYISLKHLPLSVVSPMQATRPMWTLVGALLIFGERLNTWQWIGVCLAIGTIFVFSFKNKSKIKNQKSKIAVQVYYTFYQALMMLIVWAIVNRKNLKFEIINLKSIKKIGVIALISLFLIISDNVYMLALRDPDSLIAVVSTIRRGGAVIGFAYGLIFLKEPDPWHKVICMIGILTGLICLAIGSMA